MSLRWKPRHCLLFILFALVFLLYVKIFRRSEKQASSEPSREKTLITKPYRGGYCAVLNYWEPEDKWRDSITYVVHSTMPFVDYLGQLAYWWDGPISVAIYVPTPDFNAGSRSYYNREFMDALSKLESLSSVKKTGKVGIHLLFDRPLNCRNFTFSIDDLKTDMRYLDGLYRGEAHIANYPCQALRNIARFEMKTRLFVMSDIENIPSENYVKRVLPLANEMITAGEDKVVLVHRRFEVDVKQRIPTNKTDLKKLYDQNLAVEFHKEFYAAGHSIPHLERWFEIPEDMSAASVFEFVNYTNGEWEPQFVGDTTQVPFYDESFPYPHRGQTQMAYEACRAGFKFAVLNDVFTVHPGIKRNASRAEQEGVQRAESFYYNIVNSFRQRMDTLYPKTKYKCGFFKN
ncbi:unnamed protein product [Bursaphelenchus xylophilus]|uniref:(pine wood nematode) hypothetical protein n=1 Tax=Bursaphelenchus xylophilus TaxID=6326 RepID=A0A1I7RTN9_BURXY|nr:unnamed protein product [Bursaphelenchus xylophilus]CAG9122264.1 unnamed protein product [Bursaphelenchus xylophilus]